MQNLQGTTQDDAGEHFAQLEKALHWQSLYRPWHKSERVRLHIFMEVGDRESTRFKWDNGHPTDWFVGIRSGPTDFFELGQSVRKEAEKIIESFVGIENHFTISFSPPEGEIHWDPRCDGPKAYRSLTPDEQLRFWEGFKGSYWKKIPDDTEFLCKDPSLLDMPVKDFFVPERFMVLSVPKAFAVQVTDHLKDWVGDSGSTMRDFLAHFKSREMLQDMGISSRGAQATMTILAIAGLPFGERPDLT